MCTSQACFVAVGWREEQQQAPGPDISSMAPGLGDRDSIQELSMVITNTQSHLYPPGGFQLDPAAPSPDTCPGWFKYIHAAYKVVTLLPQARLQIRCEADLLLASSSNFRGHALRAEVYAVW